MVIFGVNILFTPNPGRGGNRLPGGFWRAGGRRADSGGVLAGPGGLAGGVRAGREGRGREGKGGEGLSSHPRVEVAGVAFSRRCPFLVVHYVPEVDKMLRRLAIQSPWSRRAGSSLSGRRRHFLRKGSGRCLGRSLWRSRGGSGRGHFNGLRKRLNLDFSSRDSILGACRAASLARLWLCMIFWSFLGRIFGRIFGSFRLLNCIFKNCRGLLGHF